MRPPPIAGEEPATIMLQVRGGGREMPAFSSAVVSDTDLGELAGYVHETLAQPRDAPARIGPRELDPFLVGLFIWGALSLFVCGLAGLFAEGRN